MAVANEFSGSDGDIVNAAIKALGIGPVVGVRTWGGVVGIDSRATGWWTTDADHAAQVRVLAGGVQGGVWRTTGWIRMWRSRQRPQDHAAGGDPQLDEAIALALGGARRRAPAKTPPSLPWSAGGGGASPA